MHTSSIRHGGRRTRAAVALALLLVGTAGAPATADSSRQKQWFLDAMRAEEMWRTSTGEGVTVAVIDSGVDPTNPDLQGRVLSGKDFAVDQPGDEHTDYDGHGTGMAGLIAGTGAYGGGRGLSVSPRVPRFCRSVCPRTGKRRMRQRASRSSTTPWHRPSATPPIRERKSSTSRRRRPMAHRRYPQRSGMPLTMAH